MLRSFCCLALFAFFPNPLVAADSIPLFNGKEVLRYQQTRLDLQDHYGLHFMKFDRVGLKI